jgi:DNA-binding response OmpR family regulator
LLFKQIQYIFSLTGLNDPKIKFFLFSGRKVLEVTISYNMRLFLVEDVAKVRGFLLESFEREGFTTLSFSNFEDAKDYLESDEPHADVAILDRIVGDKDGANLIPIIKRKSEDTKILILSAINDPDERSKILDAGADDYMGKPYSLSELLSRIRVLLRRSSANGKAQTKTTQHVGNMTIRLLDQIVEIGGQSLDLTPKEFRLLSILAGEPGKVWSKFKLLDLVWQINLELESNVVESTVRNLRRKMEACGSTAKIESKRLMGYWIEA